MTVHVVHRLEVVDVGDEQGEGLVPLEGAPDTIERLLERAPVPDLRERIDVSDHLEPVRLRDDLELAGPHPEEDADPGVELDHAHGLDAEVVAARLEHPHLLRDVRLRGQVDHGEERVHGELLHLPADVDGLHADEAQAEEDDVGCGRLEGREGGRTIGSAGDEVAQRHEARGDPGPRFRVALDVEDAGAERGLAQPEPPTS